MSEEHIADTVPDEFWTIIEEARQDPKRFREMLKKMNRGTIIRLFWTYEELANRLRTERYAPYLHPDLSEDGFDELANWVVAQGKTYYRQIVDRPELIPPMKDDPGLMSQAVIEYEERYHGDMPSNAHQWDDEWKQHGKRSPWA